MLNHASLARSFRRAKYISCMLHDAMSIKKLTTCFKPVRRRTKTSCDSVAHIGLPALCGGKRVCSYMNSLQVFAGSLKCICSYSYSYCIGFNFTIPLIENCSKVTKPWEQMKQYNKPTRARNSRNLHAMIRDHGAPDLISKECNFADHRLKELAHSCTDFFYFL